mgnify:CR=1 FL=1
MIIGGVFFNPIPPTRQLWKVKNYHTYFSVKAVIDFFSGKRKVVEENLSQEEGKEKYQATRILFFKSTKSFPFFYLTICRRDSKHCEIS